MSASTEIGVARDKYARTVEQRPSRFTDPDAYQAWSQRADDWAEKHRCPNCGAFQAHWIPAHIDQEANAVVDGRYTCEVTP